MAPDQGRDIDDVISTHLELAQSADDWVADIELTAATGTAAEKLERMNSLNEMADGLSNALKIVEKHTADSVYESETPVMAASVLALFDHLERMRGIAADGAQLLSEHLDWPESDGGNA